MCWGDRLNVKELEAEIKRLKKIIEDLREELDTIASGKIE